MSQLDILKSSGEGNLSSAAFNLTCVPAASADQHQGNCFAYCTIVCYELHETMEGTSL